MKENRFELLYTRFHGMNDKKIVFQGCFENENKDCLNAVEILLDEERVEPEIIKNEGLMVRQRYSSLPFKVDKEYFLIADLTGKITKSKKLVLCNKISKNEKVIICSIDLEKFIKNRKKVTYSIDNIKVQGNKAVISGWAITKEKLQVELSGAKSKQRIKNQIGEVYREDVISMFPEVDDKYINGFKILCNGITDKKAKIKFIDGKYREELTLSLDTRKLPVNRVVNIAKKGIVFYRRYGMRNTIEKIYQKVFKIEAGVDYDKWIRSRMPSKEELNRQKREKFAINPKISLVIPLYKTPERFLKELIQSVQNQTYSNWELCLSDGSGKDSPIKSLLDQYCQKDKRIKIVSSENALQISENTNEAIKISSGEYIAFSDHDDLLTPDAFYEFVKLINQHENVEAIYSDEDKISVDGKKYFQPHFKPDFNEDLLNTNNYICHLFMVSRELLEKVGCLNSEFDGSQDYDFILRCTEQAENIYHIPKILYHWRAHKGSTAENPESKMYAFDAGRRAVEAHYKRIGIEAEVTQPECYGIYRSQYAVIGNPKVSIIIPNKDHIDDLEKCINSIINKERYENYEIIIVENNSKDPETFAYYKKLEEQEKKTRVIYWDKEFNYSAINNFGVNHADGDYILFLNNDAEFVTNTCIEEMLGYCQRDDVGVVGARLYYPDDTIQHAGVIIGLGGTAGHIFLYTPRGQIGYFAGVICAQDYSAVTAACMMTKKSIFEQIGGFDEKLAVAYNDVDYCLKVREKGKLVVYNPYAELYHYESKSRKKEDTRNKRNRLEKEEEIFQKRWSKYYETGDPYYNCNFSKDKFDCSLEK